ncbi:MAG: HAD-IA family hydrolase [Patescibacteria group bacterium]|jgi:HAD superfamily hydrolase (TIGR01509 family)
MNKTIKAIIFDWNGVIIDDLDAVARANCDIVKALSGKTVGPSTWFQEIKQDWHKFFFDNGVSKKDIEKVLPMMKTFYPKYADFVKLTKNANDVLVALSQKGIKMGILSSVDKYGINSGLNKFNLQEYFSFIISGQDVEHPKPHPEGLKKALSFLNIEPKNIVYIDDMSTIFPVAQKLGITTIGFKSRISNDLSSADIVIDDLSQILSFIK